MRGRRGGGLGRGGRGGRARGPGQRRGRTGARALGGLGQNRRERRRASAEDGLADVEDSDLPGPADTDDLDELAVRFTRRTGVRLTTRVPVVEEGSNARGPVEGPVARLALPTVEQVVLFYPESVRGALFRELHVFGRFHMRGKPFLGAAMPKKRRIHLAIRQRTKPASLRNTMHHEIAHLIENHPKFPVKRWMAISDGQYTGRGHRDDKGKQCRAELLSKGFVTAYAAKNRHEDFAELAELAFTKPRKALRFAEQHDAIARKLDMLSEIYDVLVPELRLPWER